MSEPLPNHLPATPAPPTGFYRFGWHGITLILPNDWNLAVHEGDAHRGALLFNDLKATRFGIRWKSPSRWARFRGKDARPLLQATRTRLLKRFPAEPETLAPDAFCFRHEGQILALVADAHRLYELHWPTADAAAEPMLRSFLADSLPMTAAANWHWSVYGARGSVPAWTRLRRVSLLPGETSLEFVRQRQSIVLGSRSLADSLLRNTTLRRWATLSLPAIHHHQDGQWLETPEGLSYVVRTPRRRIFQPPVEHRFSIHHDAESNRIHWTHSTQPAKK